MLFRVLEERKRRNSALPANRRRNIRRQWFTHNVGHSTPKEHLSNGIAGMKASPDGPTFRRHPSGAFPETGEVAELCPEH